MWRTSPELLEEIGIEPVVRECLPHRPNVWGVKPGRGGGRRLLLAGHTDVVHVRGWREQWRGTEREDPFGAAIPVSRLSDRAVQVGVKRTAETSNNEIISMITGLS